MKSDKDSFYIVHLKGHGLDGFGAAEVSGLKIIDCLKSIGFSNMRNFGNDLEGDVSWQHFKQQRVEAENALMGYVDQHSIVNLGDYDSLPEECKRLVDEDRRTAAVCKQLMDEKCIHEFSGDEVRRQLALKAKAENNPEVDNQDEDHGHKAGCTMM